MSKGTIYDASEEKVKRMASLVSLSANVCITALKVGAAILTGSVSLISESIHSATDVAVSLVTFFSIRAASVPPDEEHPYGHGKIESLAGFGESIFLLLMVVYIFREAVGRLLHGAKVQHLEIGIWIMCVSAATSIFVGPYLRRVAKKTESMALKANGRHQIIDFVTSAGVLLALVVTKFSGWQSADAWFAVVLAVWIAINAVQIAREAVQQLIDRRVSDDEIAKVHLILRAEPELISYHRLRTRHSGHVHYIDVHVVVPNDWSVVTAHSLADRLERALDLGLHPAQAVVHIDPYDPAKASNSGTITGRPKERKSA
jgi:cation diffusion facilitator family transporter